MTTATKNDFLLMSRIFPHPSNAPETVFDAIPLDWKLGGEELHGIPASFERSCKKEIVDANLYRWTYTGHCPKCGFTVTVTHWEYRDYPVSEWLAEFTNGGDADTPILSDVTLGGEIPGRFTAFVHGNGDNCNDTGYEWFTDPLEDGGLTIHPNDGTSCNGAFPYMKLAFEDCVVRAAVGWSARWKASAERTENGVRYACGQLRCSMKIRPGETMRTPRLTLMISEGDDGRSVNLWRRWYIDHILPREFGRPIEPALCLHLFGAEGKPEFTAASEANQIPALREYVRRGLTPDVWWVDAGWYKCDYNWPHIGTWKPDAERFPNGLRPLGEECDKYGARFLLWFEPERVVAGTELSTDHPEWLLPTGYENDGNSLLNLGDPAACDWIIGRVDSLIKESHIRVYRQDFNFNPAPCWDKAEEEDRIGAIENLHVQGYLRYWDALIERNPGLWIDSCASGGRRNDLETMRRAVPLHFTDVGYGRHEIKQKQFRQLHEWIPYFRSHNMSWDREWVEQNGGTWAENDEFSFLNAMVPSLTCMTEFNAPDEEFERSVRMVKIWRRAAKLTLDGDYYPLTECRKDLSDWYAVQFEDDRAGEGFVEVIRNRESKEESFNVPMRVIPGKTYRMEDPENPGGTKDYTSAELADGFRVSCRPRSGYVFFYTIL